MADNMIEYTVRCVDGRVRHETPFATFTEANEFAQWGHVCARHHEIDGELVKLVKVSE